MTTISARNLELGSGSAVYNSFPWLPTRPELPGKMSLAYAIPIHTVGQFSRYGSSVFLTQDSNITANS